MTDPLIRVDGLTQRYGVIAALDGVSLDIPSGAFVVLLGPSGSGKTTLLNAIGGFLFPEAGTVILAGRDVTHVPPARRPTTTVFQDYALFPHMTIGANVGFGLRMRGVSRDARDHQAAEALALVGLPGVFDRKPHQLSGGQRQRVALARALVVEPLVLLLDEPLGALDLKLRRQMQDELKLLQRRVGTTFVHVTHDQEEAMALADILVVMNHGRIEDIGPAERVYARPSSLFTAGFMGEITRIPGHVVATIGGNLRLDTAVGPIDVPGELAVGSEVVVAVRPEHIVVGGGSRQDIPLGELAVGEVVFQGSHKRLLGSIGGDAEVAAIVKVPVELAAVAGDRLAIAVPPRHLLVYPKDPAP